jgi:hypothetical protein
MKGSVIARTSCSSYQWQYITRPLYPHRRLNHIRIQHRIYFRTRTRTIIHPLRLRRLAPPRFSTQTAHYRPPTRILPRLLQSPYYPNQFRLLYIHSLLFRLIEPTMGSSGSRRPLHMSVVHTRINPRHRGQRVPMLALHRHPSCRLVCLFRARPNTSTSISHTSSVSTILHNRKRQRVTVHARREYHIIFVLPRAGGQLLLRH